jgi:hypothetical protein
MRLTLVPNFDCPTIVTHQPVWDNACGGMTGYSDLLAASICIDRNQNSQSDRQTKPNASACE